MKKRLLITSIVMMLVVAVALSTATYAWFTSSTKVDATAVVLTASTMNGDAILISHSIKGTGASNTIALLSAQSSLLYPATPNADDVFESVVTESSFQNLLMDGTGKYVEPTKYPTEGAQMGQNDVSFYTDTFYVLNKGFQPTKLTPTVNITYDPLDNKSTMAAKSVRIAIIERVGAQSAMNGNTDTEASAAVDFSEADYTLTGIWEFDASSAASYTAVANDAAYSATTIYYTRENTNTSGEGDPVWVYSKATVADAEAFATNKANLFTADKNVATQIAYTTDEYGAEEGTDANAGTFTKDDIKFTGAGFSYIGVASSGNHIANEYTVVIWLEGWDFDCTNAITTGVFSVDLSFAAGR